MDAKSTQIDNTTDLQEFLSTPLNKSACPVGRGELKGDQTIQKSSAESSETTSSSFDDIILPENHNYENPYELPNIGIPLASGYDITHTAGILWWISGEWPIWVPGIWEGIGHWESSPTGLRAEAPGTGEGREIAYPSWPRVSTKKFAISEPGDYRIKYIENWVWKVFNLIVNYQARIQDATPGSLTQGTYPDIIVIPKAKAWETQQNSVTLSLWSNMADYARFLNKVDRNNNLIKEWKEDSTITVSRGTYIWDTNDWSGMAPWYSEDTISVIREDDVEFNQKISQISINTLEGIIYTVYSWSDKNNLTQVEQFTGDDTKKNIQCQDLQFIKITVAVPNSELEPTILTTWKLDYQLRLGTDDITTPQELWYRFFNNTIYREHDVEYHIFNTSGQEINNGYGDSAIIPAQHHIPWVYLIKYKNNIDYIRRYGKINISG